MIPHRYMVTRTSCASSSAQKCSQQPTENCPHPPENVNHRLNSALSGCAFRRGGQEGGGYGHYPSETGRLRNLGLNLFCRLAALGMYGSTYSALQVGLSRSFAVGPAVAIALRLPQRHLTRDNRATTCSGKTLVVNGATFVKLPGAQQVSSLRSITLHVEQSAAAEENILADNSRSRLQEWLNLVPAPIFPLQRYPKSSTGSTTSAVIGIARTNAHLLEAKRCAQPTRTRLITARRPARVGCSTYELDITRSSSLNWRSIHAPQESAGKKGAIVTRFAQLFTAGRELHG